MLIFTARKQVGWHRMAELQEEIMWIAEAAHVPVIWATQVLESLTKQGIPSRAEVSDASMSGRSECVMLNKVCVLVRVLSRPYQPKGQICVACRNNARQYPRAHGSATTPKDVALASTQCRQDIFCSQNYTFAGKVVEKKKMKLMFNSPSHGLLFLCWKSVSMRWMRS